MQEKKILSLSTQDMIVFTVVLLGIFVVSFYLLFPVIDGPTTPDWLLGPMGLLALLGFDIVWSLVIKLLFKSYPKLIIFLILLVIILSASFLSWWIIEKTSLFDHMFG
ncbi:MAG: hypothetical protein A2168_01770 [Planctomycetes bacterium RBG_13_50_24]|nr:MAG: hypothetical protein A2168_01770 [Planctomycetes bacterium RBG_13_50_24]